MQHAQDFETPCKQPFRPLFEGEPLSSWLIRSAMACGCDPLILCTSIWGRWRAWARDIDRSLDHVRILKLSEASGLDSQRLRASTLQQTLAQLLPSDASYAGCWPWVVARGTRNRRSHGGFPICPYCLDQDARPHLRLSWRLAWHVGCEHHGVCLLDFCARCGAIISPQMLTASSGGITACWRCGADLRESRPCTCDTKALAAQGLADAVLAGDRGAALASEMSTFEWFSAARSVISERWAVITAASGIEPASSASGLRFELQNVCERHLRMRYLQEVIEARHGDLRGVGAKEVLGVQRKRRARRRVQRSSPPQPRTRSAVMAEWARLLRRMGQGCQ